MSKIRRVFLSHTSEFAKYPKEKSFIDAAIAAVNRAGCVPYDMEYFTARDEKSAQYCIEQVRDCEVYVGVIGLRYGSPVRDQAAVSYTELEFDAASAEPIKTRLVFLLNPDAEVPAGRFTDVQYGVRQEQFRQRLSDAGVTCKLFSNVHELEKLIYQALIEDVAGARGLSQTPERIKWPPDKSPYPGLLWFNEEYAPLFFGRDREVDELVGKMSEPAGRVLIVNGGSGSGKSSLVGAGLWQAVIKKGRLPGSECWIWHRIQPGDGETPFYSLAWGLKKAIPGIPKRPPDLAKALARNQTTIGELLATHLEQREELVLFIDQLEELFTRGFHNEDILNLLAQLVETAHHTENRLRIVATVRDEFIGRLAESEAMLQVLKAGYNYKVWPVLPKALQDMIERPAQATGYVFEPELVNDILREAAQEPGSLPLVAYAMKQLFERQRKRTFTHDAYKTIGGVAGAIGTQADQVMDKLAVDIQHGAFYTVFSELVHLERGRPPMRKRARLVTFIRDMAANQLIEALTGQDCRILVKGKEGAEATVEMAHEQLFVAWPKLKKWIDGSEADLRLIDYEEESAIRWHEQPQHLQEPWQQERVQSIQKALARFNKTPSPRLEKLLCPQQIRIERLEIKTLSHQDRLQIGQKLAEFGDPRPGVGLRPDGLPDIAWIEIPPGSIELKDVKHAFEVKRFRMAKYLVTNAQFKVFIEGEDGYRSKQWWEGIQQSMKASLALRQEANAPRDMVSWYEAVAFCRWLSHRTGSMIRLPAEWEWQQAASGGDPTRDYPWLGKWDEARCNSGESRLDRTVAVGMYPSGKTQQDVHDMAGNLWEWCSNTYAHPESPESLHINAKDAPRVDRGGSWYFKQEHLRVSFRLSNKPGSRNGAIGFRLAQEIEE